MPSLRRRVASRVVYRCPPTFSCTMLGKSPSSLPCPSSSASACGASTPWGGSAKRDVRGRAVCSITRAAGRPRTRGWSSLSLGDASALERLQISPTARPTWGVPGGLGSSSELSLWRSTGARTLAGRTLTPGSPKVGWARLRWNRRVHCAEPLPFGSEGAGSWNTLDTSAADTTLRIRSCFLDSVFCAGARTTLGAVASPAPLLRVDGNSPCCRVRQGRPPRASQRGRCERPARTGRTWTARRQSLRWPRALSPTASRSSASRISRASAQSNPFSASSCAKWAARCWAIPPRHSVSRTNSIRSTSTKSEGGK